MRILITGATGFIGTTLIKHLKKSGAEIIVLTRNVKKAKKKLSECDCINSLEKLENNQALTGIINLAGAQIDKRWSKRYKKVLLNSRLKTTQACVDLIKRLDTKPAWFISGSAIGYYGSQDDKPLNESSQPHQEFTHDLCKQWEDAANKATQDNVRVCLLRTGVVLGPKGGALKKMLTPFKWCLGGKVGSGKQWFSWIHMDDMVRLILFLMENETCKGAFNATSPNPVTNKVFTKTLGKVIRRPTIFPMPGFVVSLLFGEMGRTLLLKGQRVLPKKLQDSGFKFRYPELKDALTQILKKK